MTPSEVFQAQSPEEITKVFTGFQVGTLLATGQHSAVYSAIQTSLDRQVALRVYSPEASSDPERVRSVETTTRAMARLKHQNLIGLYDSGTREGMMYVVMEFVAGKSLARSLGGNPIHHTQARSIILGICNGLAHAHQYQIAHGKLTVDDILLNPEAEPKIGSFQGGDFENGKLADIDAVGRILYRMLTGVEQSPRSVEPSVLASCPTELDEIWSRCTRRDTSNAFTSVEEIVQAFTKVRTKTKSVNLPPLQRGTPPLTTSMPPATQAFRRGDKLLQGLPLAAGAKPPLTSTSTTILPATSIQPGTSQWSLARNLVIIVVLIIAILKVWGMTQSKEREIARNQKEAQEREAVEKEVRRQQALQVKPLKPGARPHTSPTNPKNQTPKVEEKRELSLAEIRNALADGNRDVLPVGAVKRADSVYLLVRDELTWPEASWFAEQHGAHLAIPDEAADMMWLTSFSAGQPFWLGVGKSGRSSWMLVDGDPWQPTREPAGLGRYLGADKHGILRAAGDQVRLPFILQWRMNGKNPGRLEPLLAATAETLSGGDPVYPPGTHFVAERAYLVVSRDVNWADANRLAKIAGGNMAVISDAAEEVHIADLVRNLTPNRLFWLGATKKAEGWQWVTGEPWRATQVTGDSEEVGSALAVSSSTRLQAADASNELSGFIIEWSRDLQSSSNSSGLNNAGDAANGMGAIDAQAKKLLQTALDKRKKELKSNASKMESDLSIVSRNMPSTLQRQWNPHIQALKQLIQGVRVPASVSSSNIQLNKDMAEIAEYASSKQQSIDTEFTAKANQIRDAYQKRLRDIMTKALEENNRQMVLDLKPKLDASEEVDTWLTEMGVSTDD